MNKQLQAAIQIIASILHTVFINSFYKQNKKHNYFFYSYLICL